MRADCFPPMTDDTRKMVSETIARTCSHGQVVSISLDDGTVIFGGISDPGPDGTGVVYWRFTAQNGADVARGLLAQCEGAAAALADRRQRAILEEWSEE